MGCGPKMICGEVFVTNLKGEISPVKLSPDKIPPPLRMSLLYALNC